jgi:UDP-N-acetylglucosamine diphosphorylase/glucosamine-1-phosphate N-acetyltransferase
MKIVIFEDENARLLFPLAVLRPVFDLRCGAMSLRARLQEKFPDCELHLETRPELAELAADTYGSGAVNDEERLAPDDDILLVNAGAILTGQPDRYRSDEQVGVTEEGHLVWAFMRAETVGRYEAGSARELARQAAARLNSVRVDDLLMRYPWDLVAANAEQIAEDFRRCYEPGVHAEIPSGAHIAGDRRNLYVAEDAVIEPTAYVDCGPGPVIIESGARITAHTRLEGPAYVGERTELLRAHVHDGCSFGPVCRMGGEVEATIVQGYTNKCHEGFLGHAYVGEWVNLGAHTCNSDLKNNYTAVQVLVDGQRVDTGSLKVGCFIGDHTKTSIGTLLNTGTVTGIMCNLIASGGLLPTFVPSFSWYLRGKISPARRLSSALDTARTAMGRRGVGLTEAMVRRIRSLAGQRMGAED